MLRTSEKQRKPGKPGGRPFPKGVSGNPGGSPREAGEARAIARDHSAEAVRTLVDIMTDSSAREMARISAANAILDRGSLDESRIAFEPRTGYAAAAVLVDDTLRALR